MKRTSHRPRTHGGRMIPGPVPGHSQSLSPAKPADVGTTGRLQSSRYVNRARFQAHLTTYPPPPESPHRQKERRSRTVRPQAVHSEHVNPGPVPGAYHHVLSATSPRNSTCEGRPNRDSQSATAHAPPATSRKPQSRFQGGNMARCATTFQEPPQGPPGRDHQGTPGTRPLCNPNEPPARDSPKTGSPGR